MARLEPRSEHGDRIGDHFRRTIPHAFTMASSPFSCSNPKKEKSMTKRTNKSAKPKQAAQRTVRNAR